MATKIFISSVYRGLEEIRQRVYRSLREIGHEPIIFESDSFTKNQSRSMLETCLKELENSHIYILLIDNEVGTIIDEAKKSVTHLEFRKAKATNKTIYVFVKDYLKKAYFNEYLRVFRELKETEPFVTERTIPTFEQVYRAMGNTSLKKEVLELLDDAFQTVPWLYSFDTAEDVVNVLKTELSSALEAFEQLKNNRLIDSLDEVKSTAARFKQYNSFLEDVFPLFESVNLTDYEQFLKVVQSNLKGGMIYYDEGFGINTEFLELANCDGITLYEFDGTEAIELTASSGLAEVDDETTHINDENSYIASAFRDARDRQEQQRRDVNQIMFYSDRCLFLCLVINNHIISLQFPIEKLYVDISFIDTKVDELFKALLKIRANNDIISFVNLCLRQEVD